MQYLSGYYWQQEKSVSLVLKHLVYHEKEDQVLFGCLCTEVAGGADKSTTGSKAVNAEFTRQFTDWFYREGLAFCQKRDITSEQLQALLEKYIGQESQLRHHNFSATVILCVGCHFALWNCGGQKAFCLNNRFGRANISCLGSNEEQQFLCGKMQEGVGILLGTEAFWQKITEKQLRECLSAEELLNQERIQKRLKELGDEAVRKGAEHVGLMLIKTC